MVNKVMLVGRLTRDPDLRYTQSGTPVANFSLAVGRGFKNEDGEEETDFINIVTWRKTAESCSEYLQKGRLVFVEGRLQIRDYEDQEGNKRRVAEVVANRVQFLPDGRNKNQDRDEDVVNVDDAEVPF